MTFSNSILAGETLVRTAMQSEGYSSGGAGWRIERDGDAEFNDVTARGNITASRLDVISNIDPADTLVASVVSGLPFLDVYQNGVRRMRLGVDAGNRGVVEFRDASGDTIATVYQDEWTLGSTAAGQISVHHTPSGIIDASIGGGAGGGSPLQLNFDNNGQVTYNNVPITRRMGFAERTVSVATFTLEVITDDVLANVIAGRKYEIVWTGTYTSSVAGDRVAFRLRETNIAGASINNGFPARVHTAGNSQDGSIRGYFTAPATVANKRFVMTMERSAGTGNISANASGTLKAHMTVNEIGT